MPRTPRIHPESGGTIPWIIYSKTPVNQYYFYCYDREFGWFLLYSAFIRDISDIRGQNSLR